MTGFNLINQPYSVNDNEILYNTDWIFDRIVETQADKLIKGWGKPVFDKPFPRLDELNDFLKQLRLKYKYGQIQASLDGDAFIVRMVDDGRDWSEPIDYRNVNSVRYSQVYDITKMRPHVRLDEVDEYDPQWYESPLVDNEELHDRLKDFKVHKDRVIRFIGKYAPVRTFESNSYCHLPISTTIKPALDDFNNATKSVKERLQNLEILLREVEDLDALKVGEVQKANDKIKDSIVNKQGLKVISHSPNDQYQLLTRSLGDIDDVFKEVFKSNLVGASGISLVDLFLEHPSGMNSTGKSQMLKDASVTRQRQMNKWDNNINDDLKLLYALYGYDGDRKWEWLSTYESTPDDEAKIRKTNSESDKTYIELGVVQAEEIRTARFSDGYNQEVSVQDKADAVERFTVEENEEVLIDSDFVPIDIESLRSV